MKTRIGLAALALLAVSCSENDNMSTPEVQANANAKAIQIGQSVQGMARAVVVDGSDVTATVLMCDGASADWTSFAPVNTNTITLEGALTGRANTATASFKAGTTLAVTLNPTLYYKHETPTASTVNSHLVAVAPAGSLAGTVVTMNATDGQQDVMYALVVNAGNETTHTTVPNFTFNHLTTQLHFDVKMTSVTGGDWAGKTVNVKSIAVQSAELPQSVNAVDGAVTWGTPSPLAVPSIINPVLTATAAAIGNPVMIKAGSSVKLDVTLTIGGKDVTYTNVSIKTTGAADLTTVTGKSHLISLNVTEPKAATGGVVTIAGTATVTPWEAGTAGTGDLK